MTLRSIEENISDIALGIRPIITFEQRLVLEAKWMADVKALIKENSCKEKQK